MKLRQMLKQAINELPPDDIVEYAVMLAITICHIGQSVGIKAFTSENAMEDGYETQEECDRLTLLTLRVQNRVQELYREAN